MEKPTPKSRNYRWATAVVMAVIFVIGTFVFYAVAVIRSHQQEAYRQTFRGLHLIAHDISGNLETLKPILATLRPDPKKVDLIGKKLDDLHKTPGYQGLAVSFTSDSSSSPKCREGVGDDVVISAFSKSVILIDCRTEITPCPNGGGAKCRLQATIPVASLVDSSYVRGLVDAVLIADARGTVRSEADGQTFAHLTSVAPYLRANGASISAPATDTNAKGVQAPATDTKGQFPPETPSTIRPTELSGENFLLFIQPQVLPLPTADTSPDLFYVVGILREPGFLDNLSNLPVAMVWAFLGLLAVLVISMPIIKMGLIGADEKLHPRDAFLCFAAVLLIASGLTLLVLDYAAYQALREQMNGAARAIAHQIQNQFDRELRASLTSLKETVDGWKPCKGQNCPDTRSLDLKGKYPPFQRLTVRNTSGERIDPQITFRQSDEGQAAARVVDRPYFQAVLNGRLWTIRDEELGDQQFFLERVRSRTGGEKNNVLAVPADDGVATAADGDARPRVVMLAKDFLTFRSPVLPPFYEFAVFDNATGSLIHHSDDTRSLLEDFYAEFSKGEELRSAAIYQRPKQIDGDYLGKSRSLFAQPLDIVPWSVAVIYDKNAIQGIHLDIVATSLATMAGFVLLLIMLPLALRRRLSSDRSWGFACQQPSRTPDYVWLSLVFISYACLVLRLGTQFLGVSLLAPSLVWALVYLTFRANTKRYWVTGLAGLVLIANVAAATMAAYRWNSQDRSVNWIIFCVFLALLILGVPAIASALGRPIHRIVSALQTRDPSRWNRGAYLFLGLTALLLIAVAPTAGIFTEIFRGQMDNLNRYGQAHLAEAYRVRYRTLQADVARMNPEKYATPNAKPITVAPDNIGVYASRTQLFPSPEDSQDDKRWGAPALQNVNHLYSPKSFGEPANCSSDSGTSWRPLTVWTTSRIPSLDNTTGQLRQFSPPSDGSPANVNCWRFENEEQGPVSMASIGGWPSGFSVWLVIGLMIVVSASGLRLIIGLVANRFLACAIDYPDENRDSDRNHGMARLAATIEPHRLHLLIGMPASRLDDFKEALAKSPTFVGSCTDDKIFAASRNGKMWSETTVLVLTDMHLTLGSDKQLKRLLGFLEERKVRALTTVILSDVYPLDAIIHPDQYADFSDRKPDPDPEVSARWIRLLNQSSIRYLHGFHHSKIEDALERETHAFADLKNLDRKIRPAWREGKLTDGEMVERVRRHAHGFYTSLWRLCSKKERVILYRLAQGYLVNPANAHDLIRLLEIGLLRRDPAIHLPNESIKRFILSAEPQERIEKWAGDTSGSMWSIVRIPLIGLILVLTVTIFYMGKETTEYVVGLLGAVAALLPLLLRLFGSLAHKPSGNAPDAA